jgi:flagellar basal-body rod protein FlgF
MAAAAARSQQLDSVADNLANAQTPGFKASRPAFQSFLPPGKSNDKILSAAVATGVDLSPGVTVPTERPLDVVPQADTFLSVETGAGTRAYTRNGSIELSATGELRIARNNLLDTAGNTISVPEGSIPTIQENGDVMVDGSPVARIGLYRIDGGVDKSGPALLVPGAGAQVTAVDEGKLHVGQLELGNASPLEATIQMISAQRHFDAAMQAIQTYRKVDERAIEVGRIR